MREFSMPPVAVVDQTHTLTDMVWDNAGKSPDMVQFVRPTPDGWQQITCRQFRDDVLRLARGLVAAGITPGARVGLMSRTRYEWTVADYAILACGAVTVPIYDTAGAEQVAWTLSDSGAVACVVETEEHRKLVRGLHDRLPGPFYLWAIEAGDLDQLDGSSVSPDEIDSRRRSIRADDIASIIYTSGTTGRPKGCVLTHRNILTDVRAAVPTLDMLFQRPDAGTLLFLPLAHAFARLVQFGCVQAGAIVALVPSRTSLLEDLASFRPTFLLAIPRVFEKLHQGASEQAGGGVKGAIFAQADQVATSFSQALDSPGGPGPLLRLRRRIYDRLVYRKLRTRLGGRCTHAISGGAPLAPQLAHFFRGAGVSVLEGYGLTETSPAITANADDATRIGTVGRPLPGVTIRIAEDGEVLVTGDVVFSRYWNDDEATAAAFQDNWFRTGDLGKLDADGYLTITGRKKDIIVTSTGKSVSPAGLEERLNTHPLISHGIVVGDQRPFIAVLVTIDEEAWPRWLATNHRPADTTIEELREDPQLVAEVQQAIDWANQAVSRAESIRAFRILPRGLSQERDELTPTMKVRRSVVQREYADEIESIYRN